LVSGSPTALPIAIGENINQTFTNTTNNIISNLPQGIEKKASKPSPVEIVRALRNANPFDRLQIEHNYDGLNVCWPCTFHSLSKNSDNTFDLIFIFESMPPDDNQYFHATICARVSIKHCPKLKIVASGNPAWVEGCIRRIGFLDSIFLKENPTIVFE